MSVNTYNQHAPRDCSTTDVPVNESLLHAEQSAGESEGLLLMASVKNAFVTVGDQHVSNGVFNHQSFPKADEAEFITSEATNTGTTANSHCSSADQELLGCGRPSSVPINPSSLLSPTLDLIPPTTEPSDVATFSALTGNDLIMKSKMQQPRVTMYNSSMSNHCIIHRPSLEEIKSMSFSDFVRRNVLTSARVPYEDDDTDEEVLIDRMELREGIAKVVLPIGFSLEEGIGRDRTGRGPLWAKSGTVGDYEIHSPIQQNARGMAGIYEYTFTDQPAISVADFRERADEYRKRQVGSAVEENYNGHNEIADERLKTLERQFWKRIGPTMPPPLYGADQEGTFFNDDDDCCGWNLSRLDSCLQILQDRIPGVTSSYLYFGMWASVFCAHTEDMNLLSINYLHAGHPKVWYAICEADSNRFMTLAQFHYSQQASKCKEFLRHKRCLISPAILKKAGIRYQMAIQYPGEAIITFPASYHFGFNLGFNLAEATNFGVQEWIPFGQSAKICLCRPDSVRIDMSRLSALLDRYEKDQKNKGKRLQLTWNEWRLRRESRKRGKRCDDISSESSKTKSRAKRGQPLSEQQRKKEFWIEIMKPVRQKASNRLSTNTKTGTKRLQSSSTDIWHLAKPFRRRSLHISMRVLCILPAIVAGKMSPEKKKRSRQSKDSDSDDEDDDDEEDEHCFAGQIVEIADDHGRIRLDGLPKTEDTWIPLNSPKLFVDGGRWAEDHEDKGMPPLHFWQEMDSKRRCIE